MANDKSLEIDSSIFEEVNPGLILCCNDKYDNHIVIREIIKLLSYYTHLNIDDDDNKLIFC